jgi:hypothetical protein
METQKHIVAYQELFDLMANEHDLILLQSEMDEIIIASQNVVKKYDLLADVVGSALLNELLAAQQEIINSTIRFNGIDEEAVKRILKKYGVDYLPF